MRQSTKRRWQSLILALGLVVGGGAGAKGSATVRSEGKRTEVAPKPAGGNLLSGKARLNPAPDGRVKVHIKLPGQKAESAEFEPGRVASPTQAGSHGHEAPHR